MKGLVHKWGIVRSSIAALTAVILLGALALTWGSSKSGENAMDCSRFSRVVLMGFAVANPDYSMKFSSLPDEECRPAAFSDNKIPPFDGSLKVGIGPRMAGNWPHEAPALRTEFRQDTSGEIQVPRTEPWHLTDVLASFGDESAESGNRQTLSLLKDASWRHHSVHAAVELKKPLNEEEAGKIHDISLGEVALLSPGRGNKPIGWPFAFPGTIGDFHVSGGRPSTSRLEEFRQWVSLLQPEDEFALQAIGLDLTELRRSANDGLIHGFTIINTPEAIARMAKNPKVRSVRVIEIVPSALN